MLDERPTAAELVAAVAEFLEKKATPQLDAATAFHAKVAVNVLRIVERELAQGAGVDAAERARLAALLGHDGELAALNAELCEQIARGDVATDNPALRAHLLQSALARMAVDSPKYPSLKNAPSP